MSDEKMHEQMEQQPKTEQMGDAMKEQMGDHMGMSETAKPKETELPD